MNAGTNHGGFRGVIPMQTGICVLNTMDPRLRGDDRWLIDMYKSSSSWRAGRILTSSGPRQLS